MQLAADHIFWSFGHHYIINEIKIQVSVLSDVMYTDYFRVQINLS